MRRLLLALVAMLAIAAPIQAQQCSPTDTIRLVRTGGALWYIVVDGDTVSQHTSGEKAAAKGAILAVYLGPRVALEHTFHGRYEGCFLGRPVDSIPQPPPDSTPGDTLAVPPADGVPDSTTPDTLPPTPPPSPGGGLAGSHEPAGFAAIVGRRFDAKGSGSNGRGTGTLPYKTGGSEGWDDVESRYGNLILASGPSAPISPPNIMRMLYPAQTVASNQTYSPGVIQTLGFTGGAYGARQYTRLYLRFAVRVSSNWQGHGTGTNKVLFVRSVDGNNRFEPIIRLRGQGSNPLELNVDLQGSPQDPRTDTGGLHPNTSGAASVGASNVARGVWHVVEAVLVIGPVGSHSGIFQMWLDGTLTHDYRDVEYSKNGVSNVWDALHFAPTWGGIGGTITADMWMDLDEVYVSGAP